MAAAGKAVKNAMGGRGQKQKEEGTSCRGVKGASQTDADESDCEGKKERMAESAVAECRCIGDAETEGQDIQIGQHRDGDAGYHQT